MAEVGVHDRDETFNRHHDIEELTILELLEQTQPNDGLELHDFPAEGRELLLEKVAASQPVEGADPEVTVDVLLVLQGDIVEIL